MSEKTRAYIYRIFTALIPIIVALDLAIPGTPEMWLTLVAAVLGLGSSTLASVNTSRKRTNGQTTRHTLQ